MDLSMNTVDLLYLTNKMDYGKVKRKIKDPEINKEVDFYKKRMRPKPQDRVSFPTSQLSIFTRVGHIGIGREPSRHRFTIVFLGT